MSDAAIAGLRPNVVVRGPLLPEPVQIIVAHAGLLIKELKIRGLIRRILIVTPANLTFQWQQELKDRFREQFEVFWRRCNPASVDSVQRRDRVMRFLYAESRLCHGSR